jgi:hypothetical protein
MANFKNVSVELKKTIICNNRELKIFSIMNDGVNVWDLNNTITTINDLFYKLNYLRYDFSLESVEYIYSKLF